MARVANQTSSSPPAEKPNDEPGGTDTKDGTKDDSDGGATVSEPVDAVPNEVAPVSDRDATVSEPVDAVADEVAPVSDAVAPVPDVVGPGSDVSALVQDHASSVAGAVVPLTQLQSDLYSFLLGIAGVAPVSDVSALGSGHAQLGCRCGRRARATALRPFFLLAGHRRGAARSGRSGRHPPPWAVGSRGCVGGVAIAAGPAACGYLGPATFRCLGPAGARRGDRGCNARCDCARSSVSGVRDGTAYAPMPRFRSVRGRLSGRFSANSCYPFHCGRWPLALCPASAGW